MEPHGAARTIAPPQLFFRVAGQESRAVRVNIALMLEDNSEYLGEWYPYEGGVTIGQAGPEEGTLLRDEEFGDPDDAEDAHARLTLERATGGDGFTLTATLYGWMYLVRGVVDESAALVDYESLRGELERLSALFPYEEDGPQRVEEKARKLQAAIADVEARYAHG